MGQLDQFAKDTFALETASVTHGAAAWQLAPELNMSEVRLDGLLLVHAPALLAPLAPPWSTVHEPGELVLEIKMPGDHLDMLAIDRAVLRRYARQVQRREDSRTPWDGEEALWIVAPHVPAIVSERRTLELVATGVYRVNPSPFGFLWIAANELPLADELIPFLIARSGRSLDAFVRWVKHRRPIEWLLRVLAYLPMSTAAHQDLKSYVFPKTDDPDVRARQRMIAEWAVESSPEMRDKLVGEGRIEGRMEGLTEGRMEGLTEGRMEGLTEGRMEGLTEGRMEGRMEGRVEEARSSLRHVLALRGLALSAEEEARIDACGDLDTLRRWHDQAVVVASAAEALQ